MKTSLLTRTILELAANGLLLSIAMSNPYGAHKVIDRLIKGKPVRAFRFKQQLRKLEIDGIIILGGEAVELSSEGKQLLAQYQHDDLNISKRKWDGIWRVVAYDIPDTKKKERDALRYRLKQWDFYQIQKSMWVIPHECKEVIAIVVQDYGLSPYVMYMTARSLPMEQKLKRYYRFNF